MTVFNKVVASKKVWSSILGTMSAKSSRSLKQAQDELIAELDRLRIVLFVKYSCIVPRRPYSPYARSNDSFTLPDL